MTLRLLAALIPAVVMAAAGAGVAAAQPQSSNPVYVDDSPSARETFLGIRDQLAAGNLDGAVRVLQRLLDEEPERLVDSPEDSDLFIGVREAVHRVLLTTPELLERYRQSEGAKAQRALDAGQAQRVEAAWLLTPAGLEAALWLAQEHLEAARFDAAWFTLRQLDAHPDRRGAGARDCAAMLAALAPYLDRAEVWEMASRWSQQATGAPVARRAEPWPLAAARRGQTPLDEGGSMDLEGLVAKALWTVPVSMAPAAPVRQVDPPGVEPLPLFARQLRMLPTVAGESVYVNDGTTVGAWDRFTLARRWMVGEDAAEPEKPDASVRFAQRRPRQGSFDEPSTVTVAGPDLLAITGTPDSENRRDGNQRLVLVEADSGRVRWSVDPTAGDEQLQGAVLRAAPVLADGVAVAAARKINTNRRLTGLYLIGVDRATGQTLWRRLVGSVGALPFGRGSTMLDAILLHNGVVYIGDQLGVIGAYEAHSGRPVWVRRIDTRNTWLSGESARPWELHVPLADGDTILTLSPDRTELLRIGAADGMIRERRSTEAMGVPAPRYLIRAGDLLGIVSESRVSLLPIANLGRAPARSHRFADPGIRGRVVGSDGKIVVPLATGVAELDTLDPEAAPREVPLESPGNVLAMASQLLVVDDGRMHSYLLWDAAERVLNERMRAEPDNPMPAVTFAELAYRASRPEHILGAVQAAAAAVDRDPASEVNAQARRRLFASVLAMVNVSQEPPGKGQAPGEIRLVDPRLIGALIDELGSLADDAGERASYLLALGRFQESQGRHAQAVETYQRVLDEPPLAAATWTGPQISLRAELEATWRLQRLLAEQGPAVYAAHEAAAEAELAALGPAADAAALERLARRYPVAAMAPRLWLRLADRQRDQGRGQAEVSALEAGLRAASWRIDSDPALVAELGGRLVRALEAQGQQAAAAQVLRELARRRPGLEFQEGTGTIAAATLLEGIEARLAAKYRWPRVGPVRDDGVQLIPGHSMLRARVPDITPSVGRALALTDGDSVSVWGPERVGDGEQAEPGPFVKRWSAPIPGRGVDLVRVENDAVYLHYDTRAGAVLEKVSATEGRSLWRTPAFPDLFPPEGPPGVRREPEPLKVRTRDGVGLVTDLLVSMDERTLTLVERSGRAVGIDAHSGDVLWAQRAPLTQVADTDLRGGTLIVAGDQEIAGAPVAAPGAGIVTVVLSIDVRTGQVLQRFESRWGQARWLRALDGGAVIVGFDEAIVSVDIERGQTNWVVDDRRVTESREAWVVGDRAFVQDAGGSLWVLAVPNGRLHPQQVRLPPEFRDGYSRLYAAALAHPGRAGTPSGEAGAADRAVIAFSTLAGVVLVSADGEVVAADAIPGNDTVVPPVPAEGLMVTVESDPAGYTQDGMMVFNMHAMEVATGRLTETKGIVLGARPSRIMLMDGRIAITAGSATVLVRAPAEAP